MKYYIILFVLAGLIASCNSQTKTTDTADSSGVKNTQKNSKSKILSIAEYNKKEGNNFDGYEVATFAGGCFWCMEASFEQIKGVKDVISGHTGGQLERPSSKQVGSYQTNHAEAIQIYFDPKVISFQKLLDVFFVVHDPTQVDRQGPDVGKQYRSAIFYHNDTQKEQALAFLKSQANKFSKNIATEMAAYKEFWVAEERHQNFCKLNPNNPYVKQESVPRIQSAENAFPELIIEKKEK